MDDLRIARQLAASGMKAQATRIRVVAENLANADSIAKTPGGDPYRRKLVTFKNTLDRDLGAEKVRADRIIKDQTPFENRYEPGHPAANEQGYVSLPNVNPLIEMADMREAQRTYEANANVVGVTRSMTSRTVDMLR